MRVKRSVLEELSKDALINLVQMHMIIRCRHELINKTTQTVSGKTKVIKEENLEKVRNALEETLEELESSGVSIRQTTMEVGRIINAMDE